MTMPVLRSVRRQSRYPLLDRVQQNNVRIPDSEGSPFGLLACRILVRNGLVGKSTLRHGLRSPQ